jgi:hypothetical protein
MSPDEGEWRIEPFRTGKIIFAFFAAVMGGPALMYGLYGVLRVLL